MTRYDNRRLALTLAVAFAGCAAPLDQDATWGGNSGKADGIGANCAIPGVAHQRVFGSLKLRQPVALLQAPGDRAHFYVVEHTGTIKRFDNNPGVREATVFLDLSRRTKVLYESGMNDLAFHPAFAQNGQLFVTYNAPSRSGHLETWRLSRFTSRDGGVTADSTSEEILIEIEKDADEHNAGKMAFGPDGLLYISIGDGGPSFDPQKLGQNVGQLFGKFLRINVDARDQNLPYAIPPSNPFAQGGGRPEIYAWGLRNPWRWSFDRETGDIFAGEVGQDAADEIEKIEQGGNYGWSVKEGLRCHGARDCRLDEARQPVVELPHPEWRSVIGGYVYRGRALSSLKGVYLFGDFVSGKIYGLFRDPINNKLKPQLVDATAKAITAFAEDLDGELYVLDYSFGGIYKLIAGPCATGGGGDGPHYKYLMRAGIGTERDATAYYSSTIQNFRAGELTLSEWTQQNIGNVAVFTALYRNKMDLGFWREMVCTQTVARGRGGCAVTNWKDADSKERGQANLGTVTMNLSPEGFTRFYVFGPDNKISTTAVLDSEGAKFVPQLCNACHGGRYGGAGGAADLGSIWREFEPALLEPRPGISVEQAEKEWFDLNQAVKSANRAVRSETEGSPTGTDHARAAMIEYLDAMYPAGAAPARDVRDEAHVPPSWRTVENPALAAAKVELFTRVAGPYCMGCHRHNALDFAQYGVFSALAAEQEGRALISKYTEDDPNDPERRRTIYMPQSELMVRNLHADAVALEAIESWVIQATDPAVPRCRVEFEVTNAGFTFFGQDIWIVGDVPEIGLWNPPRGIRLDGSAFPTWRGSALLPQGAKIEFKAVAISSWDGNIRWEVGNNRTFTVPNRSTTRVSNPWR